MAMLAGDRLDAFGWDKRQQVRSSCGLHKCLGCMSIAAAGCRQHAEHDWLAYNSLPVDVPSQALFWHLCSQLYDHVTAVVPITIWLVACLGILWVVALPCSSSHLPCT